MKTTPVRANSRGSSPSTRRTRILLVALRTVATLTAADGVFQALLAGRFLAGNFDALGLHGANTSVLAALTITLFATATAWCRFERGPWWPAVAALALVGAEGAQVWFAQLNLLELHVPLGAAIIATIALITAWAWQQAGESDELPNQDTAPPTRGVAPSAPGTVSPVRVTTPPAHGAAPPDQVAALPGHDTTPPVHDIAPSAPDTTLPVRGMTLPTRGVAR